MQKEVADFVRSVTLGQWDNVKTFLAAMEPNDADKVYAHVLKSLATGAAPTPEGVPPEVAAQMAMQTQQNGQTPPSSFLTPDDILQLSEASPKPIRISTGKKKASGLGDGISGKWKGELLFDQMPEEMRGFEMELMLNGGTVTGTITVQQETINFEPGTYDKSTGVRSVLPRRTQVLGNPLNLMEPLKMGN